MTEQAGQQPGQQPGQQGAPYGEGAAPAPAPSFGVQPQPWDPAYHYPQPGPYYYGGPAYPYPQPPAPPRRRRRGLAAGIAAIAAAAVVAVAVASGATQTINGSGVIAAGSSAGSGGSGSAGGSGGSGLPGGLGGGSSNDPYGNFPFPGTGPGGSGSGGGFGSSGNGSSTAPRTQASTTQQAGIVDIVAIEDYGTAEAAGTGMVLTSSGDVLTNNHVISGATSIKVTVVSTGRSYTATVVGTAPTKDIAVLHMHNASGLTVANFGDSSGVKVGDAVTGVGNAGGVGGTPSAAAGRVTALNKTITASSEDGSGAETLHGVIVTDAPIQAGDSGGPLYNAKDEIVGIDTAASTSGQTQGFSIPINTALAIAKQIQSGVETATIHIGYPAFLGVTISQTAFSSGALVQSVLQGMPAANAGISAGDVITKVGGTAITSYTGLQKAIAAHSPGSKVSVTYLDQASGTHTVTVTLTKGPAD